MREVRQLIKPRRTHQPAFATQRRRLGEEDDAVRLYQNMRCLWDSFPNWDLGVITSCDKFQEAFGHGPNHTKALKAGNLDTVFYMYNRNKPEKF